MLEKLNVSAEYLRKHNLEGSYRYISDKELLKRENNNSFNQLKERGIKMSAMSRLMEKKNLGTTTTAIRPLIEKQSEITIKKLTEVKELRELIKNVIGGNADLNEGQTSIIEMLGGLQRRIDGIEKTIVAIDTISILSHKLLVDRPSGTTTMVKKPEFPVHEFKNENEKLYHTFMIKFGGSFAGSKELDKEEAFNSFLSQLDKSSIDSVQSFKDSNYLFARKSKAKALEVLASLLFKPASTTINPPPATNAEAVRRMALAERMGIGDSVYLDTIDNSFDAMIAEDMSLKDVVHDILECALEDYPEVNQSSLTSYLVTRKKDSIN